MTDSKKQLVKTGLLVGGLFAVVYGSYKVGQKAEQKRLGTENDPKVIEGNAKIAEAITAVAKDLFNTQVLPRLPELQKLLPAKPEATSPKLEA